MATERKEIETLIDVFSILSDCVPMSSGTKKIINDKLDSLKRDNDADSAEIELCGKCHESPCGCKKCDHSYRGLDGGKLECRFCGDKQPSYNEWATKEPHAPSPAKCEHEANHVVSGYVSQNDITCVICSRCSTVGKRFDGGTIEWWPSPSPTPAVCEDPVPPWEDKAIWDSTGNTPCLRWAIDYAHKLEAQRDALRSRQNEVAKECLRELRKLWKEGRVSVDEWIDSRLASLGGA